MKEDVAAHSQAPLRAPQELVPSKKRTFRKAREKKTCLLFRAKEMSTKIIKQFLEVVNNNTPKNPKTLKP
jgi:hypothetical protein